MTFPLGAEGPLPNADILRLREYAKVLSGISDVIELVEAPSFKTDTLEYNYSFTVDQEDGFAIPKSIEATIGTVERMDILLRLTADPIYPGQSLDTDYEIEPTPEVVLDKILDPSAPETSSEDAEITEATSISLYLEGKNATYALSRSSLETTHTSPDTILKKVGGKLVDTQVEPVSQADFNHLLMSIVAPSSRTQDNDEQHYNDADFLKPATFELLNELFQSVTFADQDFLGHRFQTSETYFKYTHNFDPSSVHPMTSFKVRFTSNDTANPILVRSDLDTNFELSFETIVEGSDGAPALNPYTPTLAELHYLSSLLEKESQSLVTGTVTTDISIDTGIDIVDTDDVIAEATNALQEQQEFKQIQDAIIEDAYLDIAERFNDEPEA